MYIGCILATPKSDNKFSATLDMLVSYRVMLKFNRIEVFMDTPTCGGNGCGGKACHKAEVHLHASDHWTSTACRVSVGSCCLAVVHQTHGEAM